MKMVLADRAAIFVDTVYESYSSYGSIELFLASVLYSIEIYCDFAGYSLMAIGCAKVMGIDLVENFNVPYGAQSVKEFWCRWHMSLSTWLRDYVYIPLGGNRCSKVRKHINILITFLVCGIWHGAWWNFVFGGVLNGALQIIGDITTPLPARINEKCSARTESFGYHFGKIVITFLFINITWIFFRIESLSDCFRIIGRMITEIDPWMLFDGSLYEMGLDRTEFNIFIVAL